MNTDVRQLRHSQELPGIQDVRPGLYLVRSSDHSTSDRVAIAGICCVIEAYSQFDDLGSPWAQRGGDKSTGEILDSPGPIDEWPGCRIGVRKPEFETALSFEEVAHGVRNGIFKGVI